MNSALIPELGKIYKYQRIFTREDILSFARITGDFGSHHIDQSNKLLAHGLLVASIATKLGGDMNFIAKSMNFKMLKPVYQDEEIFGELVATELIKKNKRIKLKLECKCSNEKGEIVFIGQSYGMIWL